MSKSGRQFLYVSVQETSWRSPPETKYLVSRSVVEVSDGTVYAGQEVCQPLEECTEDERTIARSLQEIRSMNQEQLCQLGELADVADNCVEASKLPIADRLQKECLVEAMAKIRDQLRALVVALGGHDPWSEPEDGIELVRPDGTVIR